MSSTASDLAAVIKTEFDHMLNQDYPYVEDGTKSSVIVNITNTGTTDITIYPTTELRFDNGQGYTYPEVFYPYITTAIVIPAATASSAAGNVTLLFETDYSGLITIQDSDNAKLFYNDTELLNLSIDRMPVIMSDNEALYYFVYRMTTLFAESINDAHIDDPDSGDTQGAGALTVTFAEIKEALTYGWTNILVMQENPQTNNGPIINTIDAYLDKLTGNYFYATAHYAYHSVRQMTSDYCDALNNMDLSNTQDAANVMSAEMMADVVDFYCNGALS